MYDFSELFFTLYVLLLTLLYFKLFHDIQYYEYTVSTERRRHEWSEGTSPLWSGNSALIWGENKRKKSLLDCSASIHLGPFLFLKEE